MRKKNWVLAALAGIVIAGLGGTGWAAPLPTLTVAASSSTVVAGQSSTPLVFTVSGGAAVQGMGFVIEINSGHSGPTIVSGNILSGIFAGNNNGQVEPDTVAINNAGFGGFLARYTTATNSGTVTASGTVATINLNTSALNPGDTFTVKVIGTDDGTTNFTLGPDNSNQPDNATATTATITAVAAPEPASLGVLALGAATLLMTRKRKG